VYAAGFSVNSNDTSHKFWLINASTTDGVRYGESSVGASTSFVDLFILPLSIFFLPNLRRGEAGLLL